MSEPFLSEIKVVSFNFAPKGWALCNGQIMPINQNQALFSLLGTTYGGNGQTTFALPDLRGRLPIHVAQGHTLGERAGTTAVTLNIQQMPQHAHVLQASNTVVEPDDNGRDATNRYFGQGQVALQGGNKVPLSLYGPPDSKIGVNTSNPIGSTGGSQPHNNMMPYLVLNFIIALQGIFPSPN